MRFPKTRHRSFLRLALAWCVLPLSLLAAPAHASDAVEIPFNRAKILEYHNAERGARGIAGLTRDPRLDLHAQQLAETLAARGVLEHSPPVSRTMGYAAGGQNLAHRAASLNASQANYIWMTSPNHRKNLLNPGFTNVGIGIACSTASGRPFPVAVVDFGGSGLSPAIPPQDPIAVPAGALQGHSVACDGSVAPVTAAPEPPPAPAPAPVPGPVAAPVAPKPAPQPVAPKVVAAPAPAPPPPVVAPPPAPPLEIAAAPPEPVEPKADIEKPALARDVDTSTDPRPAGWVVGWVGALMLAGGAGGVWYGLRSAGGG